MYTTKLAGTLALSAGAVLIFQAARAQSNKLPNPAASKEWPTYGHDSGGERFSPVTQLTPSNVDGLKVAWVYHMRPADYVAPQGAGRGRGGALTPQGDEPPPPGRGRGAFGNGFRPSGVTPLVINGVMYFTTPYGRLVAVDPTTGKEIWSYKIPEGTPALRGVEFWSGDGKTPAQIVFGTRTGKLYSVAAKTGQPNLEFGDNGVVNLNTEAIMHGLPGSDGLSMPPTVYKNLVITGGATQELPVKGPAGDVRAWDMHSGKLVWTFHSIPGEGEKGNETWAPGSWKDRSGVNVWGFITVDAQRGIAYLPFGAPSVDQYGGDREGANLFSDCLVAVDANTGKYLWHYQVTHHDLWDADMTSAPALIDVKRGGKTIPAVIAISKVGLLFILDRTTGKPIFGAEERPVPQSEVPLERSSKTQPFPLKPPPLARMSFSPADVNTLTPEFEAGCKKLLEGVQTGGPYMPAGYNRLAVRFPGNHGGVNWFGTSFDPNLGYLFVNTNELGQLGGMRDHDKSKGPAMGNGQGNRVDPLGPYEGFPGGGRFSLRATDPKDPQQIPCQQPPWGQLSAINVNTGEFVWRVPLGVTDSLPPEKQKTGRPGNGGTIVTAGGLVFVAATDDSRFRAFDAKTGKEVWTFKLPAAAQATPMTYQGADGKQYVVIASTGGGFFNNPVTDDSIMAFALDSTKPDSTK